MENKGYHKLIIWQKGKELLLVIYKETENFPRSEINGLQSQLRRAILSFVLNIVEGHSRTSTKDFLKFLNISASSLVEVEACLEISLELKYLSKEAYEKLETKRTELAIIMRSFIKSVSKRL